MSIPIRRSAPLHYVVIAIALIFLASSADARSFFGKRTKITGTWDGTTIVAIRIQDRDPSKDPRSGRVSGVIRSIDHENSMIWIGPFDLLWGDETKFDNTMPDILRSGDAVEVSIELRGESTPFASSIKLYDEPIADNEIEIIGAVTKEQRKRTGALELTVLGADITLQPRLYNAVMLTSRPDDRRPDEQLTVNLAGRPLTIGGEFEVRTLRQDNFTLDDAEEAEGRLDFQTQLEFFYPLSQRIASFFELKGERESEVFTGSGERETNSALERGEMWLYVDRVFSNDIALQIGRQNFVDDREWWWDQDLDALRLYYDGLQTSAELAVARELGRVSTKEGIDPEDEDIFRILGRLAWLWRSEQRLELFGLTQADDSGQPDVDTLLGERDEDESDADLTWLGMRASGRARLGPLGRLYYWSDVAGVEGDEIVTEFMEIGDEIVRVEAHERASVRGWAFDAGFTWRTPLSSEFSMTLGFARGSGDSDMQDGVDGAFRQTGLQDNNSKFRGVDRFRYYGELLRSEEYV